MGQGDQLIRPTHPPHAYSRGIGCLHVMGCGIASTIKMVISHSRSVELNLCIKSCDLLVLGGSQTVSASLSRSPDPEYVYSLSLYHLLGL